MVSAAGRQLPLPSPLAVSGGSCRRGRAGLRLKVRWDFSPEPQRLSGGDESVLLLPRAGGEPAAPNASEWLICPTAQCPREGISSPTLPDGARGTTNCFFLELKNESITLV